MTVSGFENREHAERRADFYRSRGYRVAVVEYRSENAGSHIVLQCQPVD